MNQVQKNTAAARPRQDDSTILAQAYVPFVRGSWVRVTATQDTKRHSAVAVEVFQDGQLAFCFPIPPHTTAEVASAFARVAGALGMRGRP